ncbi:RimJ/RimL family protein N-acetyltransferase [Salipaludibacillus keqinensis]|uniref:RimJ/RimL family protein N-acetyltransferase n=1 Tax=Salipaludibacillus keqinensis TaxID=2045207 RepID=A0A323TM00_9BACI|nr:GNAT family protein [Salipaludibacillus keqinensis]PYZ95034.1 RimJ/RimL family protein N-acetyltransferase [Salipaludibacillus keqinensis]
MFVYNIDEDLSLKLINYQDAEAIFDLTNRSRNYLREWLPWIDYVTKLEDTMNYIKECLTGFAEQKTMITAIVFKREIIGVSGYNEINWSNRTAHIGYWLGEGYQGKGLVTKVVWALTDYAFRELRLNKVDIRAAEGNHKSRAIPERLGFVEEGSIRQAEWLYDHYVDHIVYGMLVDEWGEIITR